MSASNWAHDNRDMSPNRNEFYQLDNVGLQIQLGLPIQLIGMSLVSNGGGHGWQPLPRVEKTKKKSNNDFIQQTIDGIPIRKVYISNINKEVEKEELFSIFGHFGQIMQIYSGISKNDSSKKFAFVTFRHPREASRVLVQRKFLDCKGRTMFVSAADSWHQPQEGPNGEVIWHKGYRNPQPKSPDEESEEDDDQTVGVLTDQLGAVAVEEGLNALNDDCLLHIFSFLSYKEIAGVERVCKRWQGLSWRLWRCLRKLSYTEPTFPKMEASTQTLSEYLRRCGQGLTELDLGLSSHSFNEKTLAIVAKHCSDLEVLRVTNLAVGNRGLAHLGHRCSKLRKLVMEGCAKFTDQDMVSLLPKCRQLTDLELSHSSGITGKCLSKISSPLTSLTLKNCSSVSVYCLIAGLKKVSDCLTSLNLSASVDLRSSDMSNIVAAVPNLTSLSLCRCHSHPYTDHLTTLSSIGQLSKLTSLNLYLNSAVSDSLLTTVVEGCEALTFVNLSGCGQGRLSEQGLLLLSRLRNLKDLNISYLECATNGALKALSTRCTRLHTLVCRGCPDLSDEGCCQIVSMCSELELFDLSGCNNVGEATLSAAVTSVKMRTNNIILNLIVGGTNIESTESAADVPLLDVDLIDLSEDHLRPDFIDDMFFPPSDSDDEEDLDHLCCDCEFDYDDLYDPTLFPSDFNDDTPMFWIDKDDENNDDDDDDDDDIEVYSLEDYIEVK